MNSSRIYNLYKILLSTLGNQHWWPADSPFEVIIGAILTQNTNWENVNRAISNLKKYGILSPESIINCSTDKLSYLIEPAGYYNVKSQYLKNFSKTFIKDFDGNLELLKELELPDIRNWLLSIKGIGDETADSILVYALEKPVFVVDAYTIRIFKRHDIIEDSQGYKEIQKFVEEKLPINKYILGEFHALLVKIGKNFCKRKEPLCEKCPLKIMR